MNYRKQIELGEWEVRLQGQMHARRTAQLEQLKLKMRIEELETTLAALDTEMDKSKQAIEKVTRELTQ